MKRLGTYAVLLSMIAAVVVSAGYLRGVRMQRVVPATVPPDERIFRARLLFAGDVMAHLPQLTAARRSDGTHDFFGQFRLVKPRFDAADLVVVNLETTLSAAAPHTGYPCFRTPSSLARALRRAGVDVAVTANNHCCDGGARGIGATLAALDDAGLRHTGTFVDSLRHGADHPLRLAANGIRFALFNYTYGTNGLPVPTGTTVNRIDTTVIARDLAAVDCGSVDCVIAFVHWGNEYERRPDSEQRRRYCDGGLLAEVEVVKRVAAGVPTMHYAAQAVPVWVALPDYRILPPEVADTLAMPPHARAAYDRFMQDTRRLLDERE